MNQSNPGTSRRSVLKSAAVSTLGLGLLGCGATPTAARPSSGRSALFDLTKPEDNVEAIVKIQGDTSGGATAFWGQGNIFGVIDGQMAVAMLRYQSVRIGRYFRQADGSFVFRYRGMILYQDFESGEFIDEFRNPFTKQVVPVRHWKSSIGEFSYTRLGAKASREFKGNSGKPYGQPYVLPWIRGGDYLWVMLDERVEYERPSDGAFRRDNAILRYETPWDDLMNPDLTAASAASSFQTHIDWFTWLDMPGHTGGLMQGGAGRKFFDVEDLPHDFFAFAEERFPGYLLEPILEA